MAAHCTICADPKRPEVDSDLSSGAPVKSTAAKHGVSLASLYRHAQNGHHSASPAIAAAITPANSSTLTPTISATLRAVQGLAREAQRHLKEARQAGDHKATNGAITAAAKALELVGKLRGELQHGASVNVNVGVEAKVALDLRSQADALDAADVTDHARSWLAAQLEVSDALAIAAVLALMRLLPGADASPPPDALTGTHAP